MSRTLKSINLIQEQDGIELPATGSWAVAALQPIVATRPRSLRRAGLRTVSGNLEVADQWWATTFQIELETVEPSTSRIKFAGRLEEADRFGRWGIDGEVTIDQDRPQGLHVALVYLGVYPHGAIPVALLRLHDQRRRRQPNLGLVGELNAHCTMSRGHRPAVP